MPSWHQEESLTQHVKKWSFSRATRPKNSDHFLRCDVACGLVHNFLVLAAPDLYFLFLREAFLAVQIIYFLVEVRTSGKGHVIADIGPLKIGSIASLNLIFQLYRRLNFSTYFLRSIRTACPPTRSWYVARQNTGLNIFERVVFWLFFVVWMHRQNTVSGTCIDVVASKQVFFCLY